MGPIRVHFRKLQGLFSIEPDTFQVTLEEMIACHFMNSSINPHITVRYNQVLNEANRLLAPVAKIKFLPSRAVQILMNRIKETSPSVWKALIQFQRSVGGAYLVFCTIGPKLEEEVRIIGNKGEVARAFIMDAVGSVAVAKYSKYLNLLISRQVAVRGWKIGSPIMPGTKGVDLEFQRILFEISDAKKLGLHLTGENILVPLKSLSMIVGVGPEVATGPAGHDCNGCHKRDKCYLKEVWRVTEEPIEEISLNESILPEQSNQN